MVGVFVEGDMVATAVGQRVDGEQVGTIVVGKAVGSVEDGTAVGNRDG